MLPGSVNDRSSPTEKIALFRSLFRGREDVYPRRFESRTTGKTGYSPVCSNEWVPGVCEKPRVKCANCQHRSFLPVTDDVIRCHLTGNDERGNDFVAGVYPMLLDETCFFLAIDLDNANWQDDAIAILETCSQIDIPAVLERSRSGNGGHIWIFFETAIPASIARRLGSHVLTETMERRPDLGLDSYDRFFPNQDTLPRGGFGNLIALPLQKRPRDCGNSVFVDNDFTPIEDQWALLSTIQRMPLVDIEELVNRAWKSGRVIGVQTPVIDDESQPWSLAPSRSIVNLIPTVELPTNLELTLSDQVYIPNAGLPPALRNQLIRLAAFQNPEFYKAQSMRLPTWGKPRIISCAENYDNHPRATARMPRGCPEFAGRTENRSQHPR